MLLGVIYYLGAEIPHHQEGDVLAWRYFEIGVVFGLTDAFITSGMMARRGHGVLHGAPNFELARQRFERVSCKV